jgi:hypothetical protein
VNVFSDWSLPRASSMVEKGAHRRRRVASSSQSRRRQQVDRGTSVAEIRATARRSSRPEDPLDDVAIAHARAARLQRAAREMQFDRAALLFSHRSARTGYAHVRPAWYRSARTRTMAKYFFYNGLKRLL